MMLQSTPLSDSKSLVRGALAIVRETDSNVSRSKTGTGRCDDGGRADIPGIGTPTFASLAADVTSLADGKWAKIIFQPSLIRVAGSSATSSTTSSLLTVSGGSSSEHSPSDNSRPSANIGEKTVLTVRCVAVAGGVEACLVTVTRRGAGGVVARGGGLRRRRR